MADDIDDNQQHLLVVEELETQTKWFKFIYTQDIFFVAFYVIVIVALTSRFIHPNLKLIYVFYNFIVAIVLCIPSRSNPPLKLWGSILISFRSKNTYKILNEREVCENEPIPNVEGL